MKKLFFLLTVLMYTTAVVAQTQFQAVFEADKRPLRKEFHVELQDDQNNVVSIPISVIKGTKAGPVFTIVAGVHGYEYPPIIAAQELIREIDPKSLTGTLVIIPMANPSAFYGRTPFLNPLDGMNLNRSFPGSKSGSITEKTAHFITTQIIPVSDVFLDIHGGDANEDLTPFACYYNNKNKPKQTENARKLAEISGFKHVVSYPYTLKQGQPAKYAFKQAVQDGKTALSIECGKLGKLQKEAVSMIKVGVYNMLDELHMYQSNEKSSIQTVTIPKQAYIKARQKGIFTSDFQAGDAIIEGATAGYIKDDFGNVIEEVKSPKSGIILYKVATPPVNAAETVMCIGYGF